MSVCVCWPSLFFGQHVWECEWRRITSSRAGWAWKTAGSNEQWGKTHTHINANWAPLLETPTVLYSSISNKSTSVCWDDCERKGAGEKWESEWAKRRERQSTEGITVCCKHWHSYASGPHSLPPSFFRMAHSSHGHTALCLCAHKSAGSLALLLYHENIQQLLSGRRDEHSFLNPGGTCLLLFLTHIKPGVRSPCVRTYPYS